MNRQKFPIITDNNRHAIYWYFQFLYGVDCAEFGTFFPQGFSCNTSIFSKIANMSNFTYSIIKAKIFVITKIVTCKLFKYRLMQKGGVFCWKKWLFAHAVWLSLYILRFLLSITLPICENKLWFYFSNFLSNVNINLLPFFIIMHFSFHFCICWAVS